MPRNGSGVYSKPAGTTAVPNTTIESAKFNQVVDDFVQDANFARPITAGGTGASVVADARTNLDVYSKGEIDTSLSPLKAALAGYISPGFNLANNAADATNDIDFPAGSVASSGATPILMTHAAATVQLDVAYGTGNGGRFDSAISDGWWHCFIISNGTTVSRGLSKSLNPTSQPNYPSGFTNYRRVASWPRVGGTLLAITQREDDFMRVDDVQDRNSPSGFGPGLFAVSAPLGIVTQPKLRIIQSMATSGNIQTQLSSANRTSVAEVTVITTATGEADGATIMGGIFTDTNSQIKLSVTAPGGGTLSLGLLLNQGWIDTRGRA